MNKTFKVVFNRARGALMVANEVTSSIQKKGSKVVLATSMLAFLSSASLAATKEPLVKRVWNSEVVPTWSQEVESTTGAIDSNGLWTVTADMASGKGSVRGIDMQAGASGQLKNLSLAITTEENSSTKIAVYGIYNGASDGSKEGAPVFEGEQLSITVDSKFTANAYAVYATKSTKVSASKTVIRAKASQKTAYGISMSGKGTAVQFLGDVDVDSQSDASQAYGVSQSGNNTLEIGSDGKKVSISAKVDAENNKGKAYAVYVASGTLQLKGEEIDIDSTGYGYYASLSSMALASANATIGTKETKTLTIDANNGIVASATSTKYPSSVTLAAEEILINAGNVGVSAGKYATVNVNGEKKISIESGGVAVQTANSSTNATISMTAKEISIKSTNDIGISAKSTGAKIQAGSEQTEKVSIETEKEAICAVGKTNTVVLQGKEVALTSNSGDATVWLQGNTEETALPTTATSLTVNADQFTVKHKNSETGHALVVLSNSKLCIDANTTIEAKKAIATRGNSVITINEEGKKTTQISGDISFETPWTPTDDKDSGKLINSNVNIVLSGEDSYWEGRSYKEYAGSKSVDLSEVEHYGTVTGFNLTLKDGAKWTLTGDSFVNNLVVDGGSTVDATAAGTLNGTITLKGNSELIAPLATAFTTTTEKDVVTNAKARLTVSSESVKTAKLTIDDVFTYTNAGLTAMVDAYKAITLNLTKATLAASETEKASLVDGVIQGNTSVEVEVAESAKEATIGASSTNEAVTTGAQIIELSKAVEEVKVKEGSNVTVVGKTDGSAFITNTDKVTVDKGATLNLGSAEAEAATSGSLPEVTLAKAATLNVTNTAVMTSSLTGGEGVKINLGTTEAAGVLHTEKLALNGAMIFLDPAWQDGSIISDASSFSAVTVDNLNGTIVAGQNSIVALGATKDAAVSGFNKLAQTNSLTWGSDGITAGLYIGTPLTLTETSKILVNGSLTTAPTSVDAIGLTIASNGILMVDQSGIGSNKAVSGVEKVTIAGNATVAVVNAKGDTTLKLADAVSISGYTEGEEPTTKTVLTDNPFVKGTLTASSGTIALSDYADETGINVIASMGVQSMIRHADAVLAETIADRAAEVTTGNGLWVSVRGERFEQKKLGGGAGFHANMGYGAFGAEFTPTDATSLGVAFQYGFGTVKGKLYSAKNKTKDYGLTLYGSTLLGDTGVKLLGEVSYTKSTNDLTNNYFTGLNQDLDAKMISGGITAQKHFAAGSFDLVPSVGVRVSRITTDAMKAGESRIAKEKQTLVQVPIALRVNAKAIETDGGWAITPRFKVAFIPTFGDKEIKIFGTEKTVLDTTPVQGAFGVSFVKGNFTIDATANLGVSNKDTSSIGGKVGLSYRF